MKREREMVEGGVKKEAQRRLNKGIQERHRGREGENVEKVEREQGKERGKQRERERQRMREIEQ